MKSKPNIAKWQAKVIQLRQQIADMRPTGVHHCKRTGRVIPVALRAEPISINFADSLEAGMPNHRRLMQTA